MYQVQGCILSYNTSKHYSYKWKHTHTPLYTCIHTHTHTHIYNMYSRAHTHTHTHTHIYILQTQIPAWKHPCIHLYTNTDACMKTSTHNLTNRLYIKYKMVLPINKSEILTEEKKHTSISTLTAGYSS